MLIYSTSQRILQRKSCAQKKEYIYMYNFQEILKIILSKIKRILLKTWSLHIVIKVCFTLIEFSLCNDNNRRILKAAS